MLVESLWDLGIEARGVDISEYAIAEVRPDMRPYCRTGSVADPLPGRFDLVTSIEVLEHVDDETARTAIKEMTAATDAVLFSSTPNDFAEPTHINIRPPLYWIRTFAEFGFRIDLRFDASFLIPHAILFRRSDGYTPSDVEEAFALHILIRSALIEREQRIGALNEKVRRMTVERDESVIRATTEAERANALDAALAEAETRERANSTKLHEATAALSAMNAELRELRRERARSPRDIDQEATAAMNESVRRASVAVDAMRVRESVALAELAAVRSRSTGSSVEHYDDIVRHAMVIEERYRALLVEMQHFFTVEANGLAGL
jgi:hypothetical protein